MLRQTVLSKVLFHYNFIMELILFFKAIKFKAELWIFLLNRKISQVCVMIQQILCSQGCHQIRAVELSSTLEFFSLSSSVCKMETVLISRLCGSIRFVQHFKDAKDNKTAKPPFTNRTDDLHPKCSFLC